MEISDECGAASREKLDAGRGHSIYAGEGLGAEFAADNDRAERRDVSDREAVDQAPDDQRRDRRKEPDREERGQLCDHRLAS